MSIALMVLDKRTTNIAEVRNALSISLTPVHYIVSWPIQMIDNLRNVLSSHNTLIKENVDLKGEVLLLKAQVQRLMALESENNELKSLLRSSTEIQGKVLVAQLLAIDTDPFIKQVMINKGSHDGLFVGQPVLDANGVMGKIIEVGLINSRVLLLNDPHSGVPVQVTRNGVRAVAVGDSYSGGLRLVNVPQTTDIQQGDLLVTSGLGEQYPEGYPIGKVISVIKDPGLQFCTIAVEPSAHIDRSRQVLLIWPNKTVVPSPSQTQSKK